MAFVCTHLADVAQDGVTPQGGNSVLLDSISTGHLAVPKNALVIVSIGFGEPDFLYNEQWNYVIGGLGLTWTTYSNGPGFLQNGNLSQNRKIAVFTATSNPQKALDGPISVVSIIPLPIWSWIMSVDMIAWDDPQAEILPVTRQLNTFTDRNHSFTSVDLALSADLADTESALFGVAYTNSSEAASVTTAGFSTEANVSHADAGGSTNFITAFKPTVSAVTDKHIATHKSVAVGWAMANIEIAQTSTTADVCDDPISIVVSGSSESDLYTGRLFASTFDKYRVLVQQNSPITAFEVVTNGTLIPQAFFVPKDVEELTIELWGAAGDGYSHDSPGGRGYGGYVKATIDVTPGEQLLVMIGGAGGTSYNGGGGSAGFTSGGYPAGGGTDIRRPPGGVADRLLVAGGGGGSGGNSSGPYPHGRGGDGGYPAGQDGTWNDFIGGMWVDAPSVGAGKGGTQSAGGAGGDHVGFGGTVGHPGVAGVGGNAGGGEGGGFGLGVKAGGGGGGLYGGGGACGSPASFTPGGGGGSSGCPDPTARDIVYQNGVNGGDGKLQIWGNFENYTFHRSGDKGRTWDPIAAPDDTYINDNQHGNYVAAVDDDGTIHAARIISGEILYWRYVGAAWVGPVVIDTTGDAVNNTLAYLGSDGSTLILITAATGGSPAPYSRAYKSVDGGATWVIDGSSGVGDPLPFMGTGSSAHIAWIGSHIHLVYQNPGVPYAKYRRLDPASLTFEVPVAAPALKVQTLTDQGLQPRIFSSNGATTKLYIVQIEGTSTVNIFTSIDAGLHWSTVVLDDLFPSDWRANNFTFANCGCNMGSDNRLHFYGQATDDGTKVLRTISRSPSVTADWSATILVVGIPPNNGQRRATTPNNYSQMYPITRRDGFHSRKYDVIGLFYLGSSLVPPTELLQIRCVGRQGFLINRIGFGTG